MVPCCDDFLRCDFLMDELFGRPLLFPLSVGLDERASFPRRLLDEDTLMSGKALLDASLSVLETSASGVASLPSENKGIRPVLRITKAFSATRRREGGSDS